jgi:hypothetical protein
VNIRKICGPLRDACTPKELGTSLSTMNTTLPSAEDFRQTAHGGRGKFHLPGKARFSTQYSSNLIRHAFHGSTGTIRSLSSGCLKTYVNATLLLSTASADTEDAARLGASIFRRPNTSVRIAGGIRA